MKKILRKEPGIEKEHSKEALQVALCQALAWHHLGSIALSSCRTQAHLQIHKPVFKI
jgi:hypothetical protein